MNARLRTVVGARIGGSQVIDTGDDAVFSTVEKELELGGILVEDCELLHSEMFSGGELDD
jgi:hypothetical protein